MKRLSDGTCIIEVAACAGKSLDNPDINHWIFLGTIAAPESTFLDMLRQKKITRDIYITDALGFSKEGEPNG